MWYGAQESALMTIEAPSAKAMAMIRVKRFDIGSSPSSEARPGIVALSQGG